MNGWQCIFVEKAAVSLFPRPNWDANMYLMFQPVSGVSWPVPLRFVDWKWGGSATWDNTNKMWVPAGLTPNMPADLTDSAVTTVPEWRQNIIDIKYNPPFT